MAKLVKMENGSYINIDAIKFIKHRRDGYYAFLDDEGNGTSLTEKELDKILEVSEKKINKEESIKHQKLLAIKVLEDVVIGNLIVKEYRPSADEITIELEKETKK